MALSQGQINEILNFVCKADTLPQNIIRDLIQTPTNANLVITFIRKGLNSPNHFEQTLNLLANILFEFSADILHDHLMFFIGVVIGNCSDCRSKFELLGSGVRYVHSNDVNNKSEINIYIGKIIEKCISIEKHSALEYYSLVCLSSCLELYPGSCIPHKNKLQGYILGYLSYDSPNKSVITQAAKCFHYLQQCGPPGISSINHIENWRNSLTKICTTIKELWKCLQIDSYKFEDNNDVFPLQVEDSTNQKYYIIQHRITALICYANGLIRTKFSYCKVHKPEMMIDLLETCVRKDMVSTTSPSIESYISKSVQENLEIELMYLFRAYIALTRLGLVSFSNRITKVLVDKLAQSKTEPYASNHKYKTALYKLVSYLLSVLKNNIHQQYHKRLVELILTDVKPMTRNVTLSVTDVNSGKRRQIITNRQIIEKDVRDEVDNVTGKEIMCCAALDCLKDCFVNLNLSVKNIFLKHLYEKLCTTLQSIQNGVKTPPYSTSASVRRLYNVLVAALEQTNHPPLPVIVNLLKVGQRSGDCEIYNTCLTGLILVEKMCQPIRTPLITKIDMETQEMEIENETLSFLNDEGVNQEAISEGDVNEENVNEENVNEEDMNEENDEESLFVDLTPSPECKSESNDMVIEPTNIQVGNVSYGDYNDHHNDTNEEEYSLNHMMDDFNPVVSMGPSILRQYKRVK